MKTKEKVKQGKGTADHFMPLGYFLGSGPEGDNDLWYHRGEI